MNQHIIKVNLSKCIGCGLCSDDCPERNISVKDKKAQILTQNCIKCGHCVAICPKAAVTITGFEQPIELEGKTTVDNNELLKALRARRSIRKFKNQGIDDDIIARIIEAGRLTPTAKNSQDVSYIVLKDEKAKCEQLAIKLFKKLLPFAKLLMPVVKNITIDNDFFFKKAPVAIVILADNKVDGALAASNMTLMAEANGLGVLYSGFFTIAANHSKKLRKTLKIKSKNAVTTLVIGYPDVKYYRTAPKKAAEIRYL